MKKIKIKGLWILLSEKTTFSSTPWYPEQDMRLECKRPVSVLGNISWKWNDRDIIQSEKYSITTSEDGSILTVKKVEEKDKGESHVSFLTIISYMLNVHRSRLKLCVNFAYLLSGLKLWNSLPLFIRSAILGTTLLGCKSKLETCSICLLWLMNHDQLCTLCSFNN